MKIKTTLLFVTVLLFISFNQAFSQTEFRKGSVITKDGVTISGNVDYRGDVLMSNICKFQNTATGEILKYSPDDLKGYYFENGKYFVTKDINGTKSFFQLLFEGPVNIYFSKSTGEDLYYIENATDGLSPLPYKMRSFNSEGITVSQPTTVHQGTLLHYMKDAPELSEKINKMGRPVDKTLVNLAKEYTRSVTKGDNFKVFKYNKSTFKFKIEPVAGLISFSGYEKVFKEDDYSYQPEQMAKKNSIIAGAFLNMWIPSGNEKLYLRTGVLLSKGAVYHYVYILEGGEGVRVTQERDIVKIPLMIEYIYPKGIFRPKFGYGITLASPYTVSTTAMAGFDMKISKHISWSTNADFDFYPLGSILFIPKNFLSVSVLTGISISL